MIDAVVEPLGGTPDLDAVMAIEDASFRNPTSRAWYEEELSRADVCSIYVIRVPEASVAGYCAFWRVADEIHINNLAVRPDLRRRGLGRRLLAGVLDAAAAAGARRATLEVRRSNLAAIRLYAQAGFREAGVRRNYYTQPVEDALLLLRS
jgi:ribosomal-protein-alanine N-acetyltransferase